MFKRVLVSSLFSFEILFLSLFFFFFFEVVKRLGPPIQSESSQPNLACNQYLEPFCFLEKCERSGSATTIYVSWQKCLSHVFEFELSLKWIAVDKCMFLYSLTTKNQIFYRLVPLKEPSPIFSTFFLSFGDFGITRMLTFFS